jgi:hypothetical protein
MRASNKGVIAAGGGLLDGNVARRSEMKSMK